MKKVEQLIGRDHFGVVCHEILIITPGSIIRDVLCLIMTYHTKVNTTNELFKNTD